MAVQLLSLCNRLLGVDMAQLLIRDLETTTVERLKKRANRHGRSLQGELKGIIEEAAAQEDRSVWQAVEVFRRRLEASGRSFSDSVELIREDRDR